MARIPKIYVGDQMITRSKKRILDAFDIGGCYVRLETSLKTEVLDWLNKTDPKNAENANHRDNPKRRRESVVGASLFSVNNNVQEHSSDYLEKVSRPCAMQIEMEPTSTSNVPDLIDFSNNVVTSEVGSVGSSVQAESSCSSSNVSGGENKKKMVLNNFDPFRRLPNLPFAIRGRSRAQSVDCMPSRRPSLSTIFEHQFEYELAAAQLIYDGESDDSSPTIVKPVEGETVNELQIDGGNRSISNDTDLMIGTDGFNAEAQMSSHQDATVVSKWVARFENFEL